MIKVQHLIQNRKLSQQYSCSVPKRFTPLMDILRNDLMKFFMHYVRDGLVIHLKNKLENYIQEK